jgi:ribonuclease-3
VFRFFDFSINFLRKFRGSSAAEGVPELERSIGYVFRDKALLRNALTHPSMKNVCPGEPDYQRLEFLGDAVLGLVLAECLYANTGADEGQLTDARARLIRGSNLAAIARKLGMARFLRVTPNADAAHILDSDTAHEDALEALFGAVFLDGGLDAARQVSRCLFGSELTADARCVEESRSTKNKLQELVQRDGCPNDGRRIEYRTTRVNGPPHARTFTLEVWVDGVFCGRGTGVTKRIAGELAAAEAIKKGFSQDAGVELALTRR